MTDQRDTDEHPHTDRLADLHAGILSGADAASAEEHLAGCSACSDHYQALDQVSAALAAAPAVGPLPEDLRRRLDAALAAAAAQDVGGGVPAGLGTRGAQHGADGRPAPLSDPSETPSLTVVPLRRPTSGRSGVSTGPRGIRVLQLAAAAVLVLGLGAVGYGALSNGQRSGSGSSATSGGAAAADGESGAVAGAFPLTASGRDWSAAGVRAAVPKLVDGSLVTPLAIADLVSRLDTRNFAAGPSAAAPSVSAPSAAAASASAPSAGALPASRLAGGPALEACVQALLADATTPAGPVSTVTPLAVDLARWQQQPAAVILLPAVAEAGRIELWVVGENCGLADAKVLYFADVAR